MIEKFFTYIQRLALVFALGEMLFFAFVYAPVVFKILPRETAAQLQNVIFPRYYGVGLVCAVMMLVCEGILSKLRISSTAERRNSIIKSALWFLCLSVFAYSLFVLTPAVILARDVDPAQFQHLHRLSVQLNVGAMVALMASLALV